MAAERTRRAKRPTASPDDERVTQIAGELEAWRARAIPDPGAPLEAEDVARLVRGCFEALGLDAVSGESFSVHTVHYYRRKEILDAPEGRTSAARYTLRHVWQAVGARLAGQLGLVTLAEARTRVRGADDASLRRFVAQRIADARGRQATRQASRAGAVVARPLPAVVAPSHAPEPPRPLVEARRDVTYDATAPVRAETLGPTTEWRYPPPGARFRSVVVPLGGGAICLIPENHSALHSPKVARALVDALADALAITNDQ